MIDALVQYVIDQINCTPGQDKEILLKPEKIHSQYPVFSSFIYLDREIGLPNKKSSWYVYQIGTYYESNDILPIYQYTWEYESWTSLTKPLTTDGILTTLFTIKGVTFPLFRTFYMYTREKALILAVEHNNKIPVSLIEHDLYIRFYKNAFRDSDRSDGIDYSIKTGSSVIESDGEIETILVNMKRLTNKRGACLLSINGQRYKNPDDHYVAIGDYVEWIYDPTIDYVQSYPLTSARTYNSSLDEEERVILHSPSKTYFNSIAYYDDLDIEVYTPISAKGLYGGYLPIIDDTVIKMLTHRDYGIKNSVLDQVVEFITDHNPSTQGLNISIEIKFRKSGWERPLTKNTSLIADLYTLPDYNIPRAMSQDTVIFEPFTARHLEVSPYLTSMRSPPEEITQALSIETLGYNGIGFLYGTQAQKVIDDGYKHVPVPDLYRSGFTAYEYNPNGYFIDFNTGSDVENYVPIRNNCGIVELIKGTASTGPVATYKNNHIPYDSNLGYRVWRCNKVGGIPSFYWVDITGTDEYIVNEELGTISWNGPRGTRFMMVRDDSRFTTKTFIRQFSTNLMTFELEEYVNHGDGTGFRQQTMDVPGSDITLFMNNRSMIRGIDYFVDFPNVYITNFLYLRQDLLSSDQSFHYRVTGLGNGSGQFENVLDYGTVSHGFLGTKGRYIPKNDKPVRVVIKGSLKLSENIRYSQDHPDVNDPTNDLNGSPYEVKQITVPISEIVSQNSEILRDIARNKDNSLVSYMNINMGLPRRGAETLGQKTKLVCPFHATITDDLLSDTLTSDDTDPSHTDQQVLESVEPYLYLSNVSPCNPIFGLTINQQFIIRPHPRTGQVSLGDPDKIEFIRRASHLVFPDAIADIETYYV